MAKITIRKSALTKIIITLLGLAIVAALTILVLKSCGRNEEAPVEEEPVVSLLYGIDINGFQIVEGTVEKNQTPSHILSQFGVGMGLIHKIDEISRSVFDLRKMQAGKKYTAFLESVGDPADSLSMDTRLRHFVYEINLTDYFVISLPTADSVRVYKEHKDITIQRRRETVTITSSLSQNISEKNLPASLSAQLENIYQWAVNFFYLQKGDEFTVIFDEKWVDTMRVGIGQIWGAEFKHNGKPYFAIPFDQNGKIEYWDESGNSLRKQLLKAPLTYTRISSKFSNSRLHPVHKVYRPHHGVDYAAPAGTPVMAVADGVVSMRGWGGGGGNQLKIKHANNLTSGYLHLKGYASGIAVGTRVRQGQVIGYVGSTGTSTGPHLDFRLWRGSTPIDPLKITSDPVEPISKANKVPFEQVADIVMRELSGTLPDSLRINTPEELSPARMLPKKDSLAVTAADSTANGAK